MLQMSDATGSTREPLLEITIGEAFKGTAGRVPDHLALVVRHQGIRWTWAEYAREVDRLAAGLLTLGIGPGDRVGIWSPNRVEWCLTQFATARIGAIMVCVNPAYRLYELEYALNKVECKALITAERFKSSDYLGMLQTRNKIACNKARTAGNKNALHERCESTSLNSIGRNAAAV